MLRIELQRVLIRISKAHETEAEYRAESPI